MKNLFIILILILTVFLSETIVMAQTNNKIQEIIIESNNDIPEKLILDGSTFKVGSVLTMDNASESIRRLWHLGLFSDVQILNEEVENGLRITIKVDVLPSANSIKTSGLEELDEKEVLNTIKLIRNIRIGERKIARMKKQILDMYHGKGFLQAEVNFEAVPLSDDPNKVDITLTVNEGKKIKIKSINLEGNQNISDKKLRKVMETKEDRWYRSGEYKQEVINEDKKKIVALYKTKGFRDALVMRDTTYFDEKREKIILTIFIEEGKKYKFGETTITGNSKFSNEELVPFIKYNQGDIYNEDLITISYFEMMTLYNNNGYLKATVNPVQIAHGDTVDINFDFAEGNISKVSKVIIEGNAKTIEKVIRREITLLPGESFDRDKLMRSQRDIRMLNYFKDVSIDYEPAENDEDVNIKIAVVEKNTGIASMGAGYSERDKLVGTLAFSNANLFGRGQTIGFNWDMG